MCVCACVCACVRVCVRPCACVRASRLSRVCLILTLWTAPAQLLCPWGSPGRGFPGGSLVRICLPGQEAWVGARISGRSACLGATTPGGRDPRACAPGPGAATGEPTRPRARPARGKPLGEGPPPRPESNFARRNQRKPAPRQDDTQPKINKQLFF